MPIATFQSIYRKRYLIHTTFWIIWAVFYYKVSGRNFAVVMMNLVSFLPTTYIVVWQMHIAIRKLYQRFDRKVIVRWVMIWLVSGFVYLSLDTFFYNLIFKDKAFNIEIFFYEAFYSLFFVISVPLSIELIFAMIKNTIRLQILQQEKHFAEKQLLMSQLNPHFLFNTLNNMYSLSLSSSVKVPGMIIQLSELLRYLMMLSKKDYIPLREELDYVKNYIELEKIRLDHPESVICKCGEVNEELRIAPILLLPLIENAFKHGISGQSPMQITIDVYCKANQLFVEVINTKQNVRAADLDKNNTSIGLQNLSKRLAILYPDRHSLTITEDDQWYRISLNIILDEQK